MLIKLLKTSLSLINLIKGFLFIKLSFSVNIEIFYSYKAIDLWVESLYPYIYCFSLSAFANHSDSCF